MAAVLSPARKEALALVGRRRRQAGRIRDMARQDAGMRRLSAADRALCYRIVVGSTAAAPVLDAIVDERLRRPSSVQPRVRDALRLAAFELCYMDTPDAVVASQGVELVRSVAPRAAGMANAVLRRIAREVRPQVQVARERVRAGQGAPEDLVLVSGLPTWLVERVLEERGERFACDLCLANLEPSPVCVAANATRHDADDLERLLADGGMSPTPVAGLPGSFVLGEPAPLAPSGLVDDVDVVVADVAAQLVCRVAQPSKPCEMLEVGQGRGTKSVLLAASVGGVHPSHIDAVDSLAYKVAVSRKRMARAGLAELVCCHELDACLLDSPDLPSGLAGTYGCVLVDAPCSGTGTLRRHPEIAATLDSGGVEELAQLQLRMLQAASARVAEGGTLCYATCSVLREEDEDVVAEFLASEAGQAFRAEPVGQAPACLADPALASLVGEASTPDGHLLTTPSVGGPDGHFCARLRRVGASR